MRITINIFDLPLGSVGFIVGYHRVYGGYVGKLISKGLVLDTCFVVLDLATSQGGVKILLADKIVELSKPEANALAIEFTKYEK